MPPKQTKLTDQQENDIKQAFELFDADGGGNIDKDELTHAMESLGFQATQADIDKMMSEADKDGEGTIDYDEFFGLMKEKILSHNPKDEMIKAFGYFDEDNSGAITFKNLKQIATKLGDEISDEELKALINSATRGKSDKISKDDFLRVMHNQKLW